MSLYQIGISCWRLWLPCIWRLAVMPYFSAIKKAQGLPVLDAKREQAMHEDLKAQHANVEMIVLHDTLVAACRRYQQQCYHHVSPMSGELSAWRTVLDQVDSAFYQYRNPK